MKNTLKIVAVTALAGAATLGAGSAAAWWGNDYYDDYYGPWGGGPWYGYPGYGYGGYPGYGYGGYPRYGGWRLPALRWLGLPALRRLWRLPGLRLGWLSLLRGTPRRTDRTGHHQHFQVTAGTNRSAPSRARFFCLQGEGGDREPVERLAWARRGSDATTGTAAQTNSVISAPCAVLR